ncbi:hypothetical protein G6Y99_13260, partial [Clostridium perfringens]|nr:hypothetical protein [Clostridium perfringens]
IKQLEEKDNKSNILELEEHFKEIDIKLNSLKEKMKNKYENASFLEIIKN